jgi:hypothetical protein
LVARKKWQSSISATHPLCHRSCINRINDEVSRPAPTPKGDGDVVNTQNVIQQNEILFKKPENTFKKIIKNILIGFYKKHIFVFVDLWYNMDAIESALKGGWLISGKEVMLWKLRMH